VEASPTANEVTTYNETQAASANITTTTQIYHEHLGASGNPVSALGGQTRGQTEFLLKQNTQYAIILQALDNNDNSHNIILNWYEHTQKD
jgi:hypothetical protein